MPEAAAENEALNLAAEFPPVSTEQWRAAIQADLKGADYERRLIWRTEEGLEIKPFYRAEDLEGLEAQLASCPGQSPYVRGSGETWIIAQEYAPGPEAIRADELHERGAHAVQELGFAIAAGVERLSNLSAGKSVDSAAREIEFVFAVGPLYFIEIAKLRAARMLWAAAVAAFNPKTPEAAKMRLAARTARRDKSVYDRYTNLLRVTTEALSAVIGGCDALTVEPFGFDEHLAVNVQRMLRDESHLDAVSDPAGGSYFIEALTASLAREAWRMFQQVEAAGGYSAVQASGAVESALAKSREAREKAVAMRRRVLVGVNNYPNVQEKTPEFLPEGEIVNAGFRLAVPFERIRERTARHASVTGKYPKVLLLKRGDVKMRGARENFCLNFFGCAGFDIVSSDEYLNTDADLIVLCSSDPEYPALAQEVCAAVKTPVVVAGNPKEQAELVAAGVQGFVHVQSDAVKTLTEWQDRFGMRK